MSNREQAAIDRYLAFLANKDATVGMLTKRLGFVKSLSTLLINAPHCRESYQQAVDKVKAKYSNMAQQALDLFTHEFYAFWINDASSINLFKRYFCFDIETGRSNLHVNPASYKLSQHSVLHTYTKRPLYLS